MRIKLRKMMGPWTRCMELYEWNPGNGRWYPVHRRNIIFKGSKDPKRRSLNIRIQRFFNRLLNGDVVEVDAVYSKPALMILSLCSVSMEGNVPEPKNASEGAVIHGKRL